LRYGVILLALSRRRGATVGSAAENAVWTYEDPYPGVAAIKGHLAFYPDRVDRIEELPRR